VSTAFFRRAPKVAGRIGACAAIVLAAGVHTSAAGATEGGTVRGQHGDWQIVCNDPAPGAKGETCALVQSVMAEDRTNVGVTVTLQRRPDGSNALRFFVPVGVLLTKDLSFKIDESDLDRRPFVRCQSYACYTQFVAEDALLTRLRAGKTMIVVIYQTEEAGIGIPISLKGFSEALAALK
jgi:invasion protein IalB